MWRARLVRTIDLGAEPKVRARVTRNLSEAGLVWRGDDATPGALSIPIGREGERRLFWPLTAVAPQGIDGIRVVRRAALDKTLVAAVRSVPLDQDGPDRAGEPSEWHGRLPTGMSLRTAEEIGEAVGISFAVRTAKNARARGVDVEHKRAAVAGFWHG